LRLNFYQYISDTVITHGIQLVDRCDPAAPVMRGANSPLFIGGALIRDPRAVPNLS
jgi:hypothetical protein